MSRRAYPTYKQSGVEWLGEIPAHWGVLPIKRITSIPITDGPHETPEILDDGIPFISAEAIKNDKIDFTRKRGFISIQEHERFSKKYRPKKGDIYIVKSGATTGNVACVETDEDFNIWSPLAVIRPNHKKAETTFVFFFMKSKNFFQSIELGWSYGTQQNIGMSVIENLPIVVPSLQEQRAIATFVDRETVRIDDLIEKKQKQIELLQEKRSALISHAVTKGLDSNVRMKDSGIEWLGEIPEHWDIRRFKFLLSEPLKYGANEVAELDDPDLPRYIRITDVNEGGSLRDDTFKSLPEDVAKPYLLSEGDLLFARSGATVGKTFFYRKSWRHAAYAGYLIRARLMSKHMIPAFAAYFCRSNNYWNWMRSSFIQATIQNVSAERYANMVVSVPSVDEQKEIIAYLDRETMAIDQLTEKVEQSINMLREYRTALISAVVTGKVDVRGKVA